ncbi:hypothetical protein Cgig2_004327 [Carnegiea gigantea]|uniref:Uncharacterized protein n=1 Tax=Carnegiea gigantea TaxID=171969 RepID=A0A9Q1JYI2_9CARY|nr:hypothetical protein Cgig2_004327 [Carnegiea gigantea]
MWRAARSLVPLGAGLAPKPVTSKHGPPLVAHKHSSRPVFGKRGPRTVIYRSDARSVNHKRGPRPLADRTQPRIAALGRSPMGAACDHLQVRAAIAVGQSSVSTARGPWLTTHRRSPRPVACDSGPVARKRDPKPIDRRRGPSPSTGRPKQVLRTPQIDHSIRKIDSIEQEGAKIQNKPSFLQIFRETHKKATEFVTPEVAKRYVAEKVFKSKSQSQVLGLRGRVRPKDLRDHTLLELSLKLN